MVKSKSVKSGGNIRRALIKKNDACAPGLTFEDGHCARLPIIVELALAYNASNPSNKIQISHDAKSSEHKLKRYIVNQLEDRLKDVCSTHDCWCEQEFVEHMREDARKEYLKYTHRPISPQGRFTWLSNYDIDDALEQYAKKYNFMWGGAVPMDFATLSTVKVNHLDYPQLISRGKTKFGMVINLDDSHQPGSHWVAMFTDFKAGNVFYFDSYGIKPEKRVEMFMKKHEAIARKLGIAKKITVDYNKTRHQYGGSECGVYSMLFVIRMAKGGDFYEIFGKPIPDEKVNKCRRVYFNYPTKNKK